jgi:hypothetical protein
MTASTKDIPDCMKGSTVKKATTKRERKYGKKNEDGIRTSKNTDERVVKLMVDYSYIMKFKNKKEAEAFINKIKKEAEEKGQRPTSFIYI